MKSGKYTKRFSRTKRMVFIYLPLLTFQIRLTPTTNKSFARSGVGKLLSHLKIISKFLCIYLFVYIQIQYYLMELKTFITLKKL